MKQTIFTKEARLTSIAKQVLPLATSAKQDKEQTTRGSYASASFREVSLWL